MLTELYIEALLVDEELADLVWDQWISEHLCNEAAFLAWSIIAFKDLGETAIKATVYVHIQ